MEIGSYFQSLTRQLHLGPGQEREIVLELESHLEDKVADLEGQGVDRESALQSAVEEMGSPDVVGKRMDEVHSTGVWQDVALATVPHFLLAALFALHLWTHYFLVALLVVTITLVTWKNWHAGNPSKWSYSWLGYTLAAPAISWLLALITLSYGGWTLVTTGELPFNFALFILLVGYVPISMWIMASVISKMVRRDWLLASFSALPFPFLTSWVLFLNWQGGLWGEQGQKMEESDTARALIFLALALTTAVFLRMGPRLLRIGLLTISTAMLVLVSAMALPVSLGAVAILMMMLASVAFLLSPVVLETRLHYREARRAAGAGYGGPGGNRGYPPSGGNHAPPPRR